MHLLATITTSGYDAWKTGFDAHAEDRGQSGLNLLQLWHDADAPARVVALFEVADRPRAEAWVKRQSALHGPVSAQFLRTV
jgi:hypothetical protein